jgi:hypothetical protein
MSVTPARQLSEDSEIIAQAGMGTKARPDWKNNSSKRAGGMTHVVETLPSKHKVLSSISSTAKTKQNKKKQREREKQ